MVLVVLIQSAPSFGGEAVYVCSSIQKLEYDRCYLGTDCSKYGLLDVFSELVLVAFRIVAHAAPFALRRSNVGSEINLRLRPEFQQGFDTSGITIFDGYFQSTTRLWTVLIAVHYEVVGSLL